MMDGIREALTRVTVAAIRADRAALETALAMAWQCLDDQWTRLVVEHHTQGRGLPESRVVLDGRIIHRQWWEQVGECTWALRQEWCP